MKKSYRKWIGLGFAVTMSAAAAMTSFATVSYSEWYYNQFNEYPDGNITDWEQDPVYWAYLSENDPQAYKNLTSRNDGNSDSSSGSSTEYAEPVELYWDGKTAKWSVDGKAAKYQVRLYRDDKRVASYTTTKRSYNFTSDITSDADYSFSVRAYSKSGIWSDWEDSDSEWFKKSSSSNSSNNTNAATNNSSGPSNLNKASWSNRWVGGNDVWQVRSADGSSYVANSWWMDGSTNEWYLLGCTGEAGKESYMSAGLFRDAKGDWYLLNPIHDGTYGRMLSGDSNGNYTLNYNGQSVAVTFNKNHDGTYGKITSDVNAIRNVLGNHFELNYVPATAQ